MGVSNGGAGDSSSGQQPENLQEIVADNTLRARKGTITLCSGVTRRVRSFLDEEELPADDGGWISGKKLVTTHTKPADGHRWSDVVSQKKETGYYEVSRGNTAAVMELPETEEFFEEENVEPEPQSPLVGFLVSYDRNPLGDFFRLFEGRTIISCQQSGSTKHSFSVNGIVLDDPSISPAHATIQAGKDYSIRVIDQFSEGGTVIKRAENGTEMRLSGCATSVSHGDVVTFGKRSFNVCLIRHN